MMRFVNVACAKFVPTARMALLKRKHEKLPAALHPIKIRLVSYTH
jgi:hypothetical protein